MGYFLLLNVVFVEAQPTMATEIVAPVITPEHGIAVPDTPLTAGEVSNLPRAKQPLKDQTLADTANMFSRIRSHQKPAQQQFMRSMGAAGLPQVGVMKRQIEKLDDAINDIMQIEDPKKLAAALRDNRRMRGKLVADLAVLRANIRTAALPELTEVLVANQKVGEEREKVVTGLGDLGLLRNLTKETLTAEERETFEAAARERLKVESQKELVVAEIEQAAEKKEIEPAAGTTEEVGQ
jgi:hypothetical protein